MRRFLGFLLLCFSVLFAACSADKAEDKNQKLKIVTTTGMIGDAVKNIVKDSAEVITLMGPGVDPHLYKATQGDLQRLNDADIIFYNGLHLEGKMGEVLEKISRMKAVIAVAESLDSSRLKTDPAYQAYDPHVWFDVSMWADVTEYIGQQMQELDTANAAYYQKNTQQYVQDLEALHLEVKERIQQIPKEQRILITAHDAFAYFGRAYDIEVKGLQGISTISEYGLKDITKLVDLIVERNIKAVFVETSVSERAINSVVEGCQNRGHDVKIGGALYSDAMGAKGTEEGTYTGMVRANVNTIVEALK
jgi:manganese/zinc/iron transport system substrate-binding protein